MFGEGVSLGKREREERDLGRGNLEMEVETQHLKKEREESRAGRPQDTTQTW